MLRDGLVLVYLLTLSGLALYGVLGLFTMWMFLRHRHDASPAICTTTELPSVTVQLPIYNERYVVKRLLAAAARLDYPRDKLQIQVLDDSTDDTTKLAAALVARYRQNGIDIELRHREQRMGFKAGALAAGLATARGEYVAIFDADFQPQPDFLQKTIPHFLQAPELGMVQARWGHLNSSASMLAGAQALALDKHFVIEQTVRHRAELFPKFNGTAGIWRRACLEDAGGWQDDTVCEDLCLSTRAVLRGWRFHFLPDVVAPAELPATASAYKSQQARWAKGSTQCLIKYGPAIAASRLHSRTARIYALLSMAGYATSLLLVLILLLQVPLLYLNVHFSARMLIFTVAGIGQPLLFVASQQQVYRDWPRRLLFLPALLITAIGLSVTIGRAVVQAVISRKHTFVRTPKQGRAQGAGHYRLPFDRGTYIELGLAAYAAFGLALAFTRQNYGPAFFLATCFAGFGYVGYLGLRDR